MARLPYLEKHEVAPEHQALMKREIALNKQLIHSPGAMRAFQVLGGYIRSGSKLDPRLRELAILQVGWLARSPYEWSHHIHIGHEAGVSDADIEALVAESEGRESALEPLARRVLRAAREITQEGAIGQSSFDALLPVLGNEQLVDLVMAVAFYCAVVRVLASLQIDVEPEYQQYLLRHPLPV